MTEGSLWGGWQASLELQEHQAAGVSVCCLEGPPPTRPQQPCFQLPKQVHLSSPVSAT